MNNLFPEGGPFLRPVERVAELPGILLKAGFFPENLAKLGILRKRGVPEVPAYELRNRCQGGGALELLCRLFVLALEETEAEANAALAPLGVEPLVECGLLERKGGRVRSRAALAPVGELILARDFSPAMTGLPAAEDHVLPVGAASMIAAYLTVRGKGETVLDLGCGQGVQMVLAGEHAARVVGTDINPRALNFAAFNVALNARWAAGAGNAVQQECRLGSFFEPVEDLRGKFDLIVSNPPFVITPAKQVVGFSSSLQGDGTVEAIFRGSPAFLAEDGWCISLASWHHSTPEDWAARPLEWLQDCGCDVLLVQLEPYHPRNYALKWIESVNFGQAPTERQVEEWMEMFAQMGARVISFGFVVLHKRSGRNWVQTEKLAYDFQTGTAGEQLRRIFAGRTILQERDAAGCSLLELKLRVLPGLRMTQRANFGEEGWSAPEITLATAPGIYWPLKSGEVMMLLLDQCDGSRVVREILGGIAAQHEIDLEELLAHGEELVRTLLERGMVKGGGES